MSPRTGPLNLAFVEPDAGAICLELAASQRMGATRALLYPGNKLAETLIGASRPAGMTAVVCASLDEVLERASPKGSGDAYQDECIVLLHENAADLSDALLKLVDLPRGSVIAPITSHYWKHRPLFLISIPRVELTWSMSSRPPSATSWAATLPTIPLAALPISSIR